MGLLSTIGAPLVRAVTPAEPPPPVRPDAATAVVPADTVTRTEQVSAVQPPASSEAIVKQAAADRLVQERKGGDLPPGIEIDNIPLTGDDMFLLDDTLIEVVEEAPPPPEPEAGAAPRDAEVDKARPEPAPEAKPEATEAKPRNAEPAAEGARSEAEPAEDPLAKDDVPVERSESQMQTQWDESLRILRSV